MADVHADFEQPTKGEKDAMRDRMYAYIFPNEPQTAEERAAFDKAVKYQIAHEKTIAAAQSELNAMPDGVSSFSIGTFSMNFGSGGLTRSATLNDHTICPHAYGVLLRAGLLYKGVRSVVREWL